MSIGYLDAYRLAGRTVELTMTDWIRERKHLPCLTVIGYLERPTDKASGLLNVLDGDTGEMLAFGDEMLWIPYSQTERLVEAASEPDEEECDCSDVGGHGTGEKGSCWCACHDIEEDEDPPANFTELVQRGRLEVHKTPDFILEQLGFDSRDEYDVWERSQEQAYRESTAVADPTEEVVLPDPEPERLELDPLDPGYTAPKPYEGWAECGVVEIVQHGDSIRFSLNNDDLPRVLDLDDVETYDLATAAYLVTITLDERKDPPMPMTINGLERVRAVIKRFDEAAAVAIKDLEADCKANNGGKLDKRRTLITGTPGTSAVRRASMDLTRELAELRRRA